MKTFQKHSEHTEKKQKRAKANEAIWHDRHVLHFILCSGIWKYEFGRSHDLITVSSVLDGTSECTRNKNKTANNMIIMLQIFYVMKLHFDSYTIPHSQCVIVSCGFLFPAMHLGTFYCIDVLVSEFCVSFTKQSEYDLMNSSFSQWARNLKHKFCTIRWNSTWNEILFGCLGSWRWFLLPLWTYIKRINSALMTMLIYYFDYSHAIRKCRAYV